MQYEYLARTFEGIIKPMIPIRTQTVVYSPKISGNQRKQNMNSGMDTRIILINPKGYSHVFLTIWLIFMVI